MKNDCNLDANHHLIGTSGAHPAGAGIATIVGRLARKGVAEPIDVTRERPHRSKESRGSACVESGSSFDDYGPAYAFGLDARRRYPSSDFADVESEMSSDWAASRGASILTWAWAKHAARDAWNRIRPSTRLCA